MSSQVSLANARAVAYERMSTHRQGESVEDQLAWAERVARVEKLTLVRHFDDPGICGDDARRPGLAELLAFVDAEFFADRQVSALVVWDLDRLSRASSVRTAAILSRLMDAGVTRVLTRTGWVDLTSEIDLLLMNVKADFTAAGYVKSLSANVTRTFLKNAREGRRSGGRIPRGYRAAEGGKLALGDAGEVELVRWVFTAYADDAEATTTSIARDLNARGVATGRRGKLWRANAVRVILQNRAYLGEARWFSRATGKYSVVRGGEVAATSTGEREQARRRRGLKRLPPARGDAIVVPDAHPAVIDPDLFGRVQAKLASRRDHRGPALRDRWPLGGRLYCAGCGEPVWCVPTCSAGRPRRRNVICGTHKVSGPGACPTGGRLPHGEVVRRVVELLVREMGDPGFLDTLRGHALRVGREQSASLGRQAARLERQVAKGERDLAAATRRLLTLPDDVLADAKAAFDGMRSDLAGFRAELAAVRDQQRQAVEIDDKKARLMIEYLPKLPELLHLAEDATLRRMLDELVSRVEVHFARTGHVRATRGKPLYALAGLDVTLSPEFARAVGTGGSISTHAGIRGTG
ncbi:MAG: recombinase family protein [Gemmataceae bacterium]